ncbi:MAG: sporulation peptidase YabG [Bacillota bacterium]
MSNYQVGDIVVRKSYGADIPFVISNIDKSESRGKEYILRGLEYRLIADADADDLLRLNTRTANISKERHLAMLRSQVLMRKLLNNPFPFMRAGRKSGSILHIDASQRFLNDSMSFYRSVGLRPFGIIVDEPDQPQRVRGLLQKYRPDIVVLTGHDGIRKGATDLNSFESYKNSNYYVSAVKEARSYEPNPDRLCIFAGACQSYYEAIMSAGANFASSPGRVLVHSLDPVVVSQRIATTASSKIVTPSQAVAGTISGAKGIGGISTRGRMTLS